MGSFFIKIKKTIDYKAASYCINGVEVIILEIKEVEKLLSVSRANIRYYEKEGLINPKRKENNYRDYSEGDIAKLKKVLVLRKLGFSIQEIIDMQSGALSLSDAIADNIARLEKEIEELNGSLALTQRLEKESTTFEKLDEDHYWDIINDEEQSGKKFIDTYKDYLLFELDVFDNIWKRVFFHDFKSSRKKYGTLIACGIILMICIIRGLSAKFLWQESFLYGFLYPFVIFFGISVIVLPLYILSKKVPKVAKIAWTMVTIVCVFFIAAIGIALVVLLFNAIFHFWW